MFGIGDCIAYPMHGAGYVESIEEKCILGEVKSYYVLSFVTVGAKVMVPVENAHANGLRPLISKEQCEKVLAFLTQQGGEECENWNRRYRENLEKMRTGDVWETAIVVRRLNERRRDKGLSGGELKMLNTARQLLVGELMTVLEVSEEEIEQRVEGLEGSD